MIASTFWTTWALSDSPMSMFLPETLNGMAIEPSVPVTHTHRSPTSA
jgi:hypothetical protein